MHKDLTLYSTIYSSENIVVKKDLKLKLDNTKKIFSLSHNFYQSKKFNSTFKNYFSYAPPSISNFQENNNVPLTTENKEEEHTPKLFSEGQDFQFEETSTETTEEKNEESDQLFDQDINEEEDFEIPAFLRKQKF